MNMYTIALVTVSSAAIFATTLNTTPVVDGEEAMPATTTTLSKPVVTDADGSSVAAPADAAAATSDVTIPE